MYPPTLKIHQITLKPYAPHDENAYVEMALDELSVRFMGGANGIEREERAVFKKIFELYKRNNKRWFWIWGVYKNDKLCGHFELKETIDTTDEELEIVYLTHPNERRKGIMLMVLTLIKQQQKHWNKRIIATVSPKNVASLALLEKWGVEKKELLTDKETGETYLKLRLHK